ncbi:MAG: hypothetical protein MUQ10_16710, partial [Anaerolineae bacterium]|nr:hypothetical protein [Anaerolineae bacterium]
MSILVLTAQLPLVLPELPWGYRVLAEDVACVRLEEAAVVIPGPALLRLRRDVADRLELRGVRA